LLKESRNVDLIRSHPIEDIIRRLYDNIILSLPEEPCIQSIHALTVLETMAQAGLERILSEDALCRPADEWVPALSKVEQIRDDTHDMIADLKNILY